MNSIPEWPKTDHSRVMIEAALAHVVRNRVEAAYARSDLFECRRVLMDDWARYLAQASGEATSDGPVNRKTTSLKKRMYRP